MRLKILDGNCSSNNIEISKMRVDDNAWAIRKSEMPRSDCLLLYNTQSNVRKLVRNFEYEIKKSSVRKELYYVNLTFDQILDVTKQNNEGLLSAILFNLEKIRNL